MLHSFQKYDISHQQLYGEMIGTSSGTLGS